jgi:hypothetical protein
MAGDGNQMNVIAHQAPSQDAQVVPLGMLAQDFQISPAVFVREECDLPVVTPLRDLMWRVGNDEAGPAWHCQCSGGERAEISEKSRLSPFAPFAGKPRSLKKLKKRRNSRFSEFSDMIYIPAFELCKTELVTSG